MEFNYVLENRRSVRKYDPMKKVTKEQLNELFKAAILAPSWKNSQTARYYCINTEEMLSKFKGSCLPEFNAGNVAGAPVIIVTTFVHSRSGFERDGQPTNELGNGWGFYDLGLHNENLLLKAAEMGLGTLVMGIRDEKAIRELLQIGEEETVVSVIGLGYPDIEPTMPKRKSVEDIVKFY